MATIKSYTDLEQSKKLAEILSLDSADMVYIATADDYIGDTLYKAEIKSEIYISEDDAERIINCWSLAAMLNYLKSKNKFPDIKELSDGRFKLTTFIWDGKNSFQVFIADNLVDACYKLVLKLHECEML